MTPPRLAGTIVVLVLPLLGCQDGDPPPPPGGGASAEAAGVRSGSRLGARWLVADGGAELFAGWRDRQLAADCRFARAEDGTWRCLPADAWVLHGPPLFADRDCRQRVSEHAEGPFAVEHQRRVCPGTIRLFRTGGIHAAGLPRYTLRAGGCVPAAGTPLDSVLLEPVPPTELVAAQLVPRGSGRLRAVDLQATDGARGLLGWQDDTLASGCELLDVARVPAASRRPSAVACVPPSVGSHDSPNGPFSDDGCQRPALEADDVSCLPAAYAWERARCGAGGGGRVGLRRVGARVDAAHARPQGQCAPQEPVSGGLFFELGEVVPPEGLVRAAVRVEATGGRVRRLLAETADGDAVIGLWDTALEARCEPTVLEPGEGPAVCLPLAEILNVGVHVFTDPTCTAAAVLAPVSCEPPRFAREGYTTGRVLRVGARHEGALYERQARTRACTVTDPPAEQVAFVLGAPVETGELAGLRPELR